MFLALETRARREADAPSHRRWSLLNLRCASCWTKAKTYRRKKYCPVQAFFTIMFFAETFHTDSGTTSE